MKLFFSYIPPEYRYISGSIENPMIKNKIVAVLEGTKPAFELRKIKYE